MPFANPYKTTRHSAQVKALNERCRRHGLGLAKQTLIEMRCTPSNKNMCRYYETLFRICQERSRRHRLGLAKRTLFELRCTPSDKKLYKYCETLIRLGQERSRHEKWQRSFDKEGMTFETS